MASGSIPPWLVRFLRQQQLYVAVAMAIYLVLTVTMRKPGDPLFNPVPTVLYTLVLCNMVALLQWGLSKKIHTRQFHWLAFLPALFILSPLMIVVATYPVYLASGSEGHFWSVLRSGWRFPLVATLIFGIVSEVYRYTTTTLEAKNLELQTAVENEMAQREFQEQELERAREIQQALLPKVIPQIDSFQIAGTWEPARIVGGDYYDVIRLSDTKVGICVADVSGKGVSAALLMANVQATVRAFASESTSPAWLCSRVNSVLCTNLASGKFVTMFYGVLDSASRTLKFTSAGHLAPILIGATDTGRSLDNGGALLGVLPNWKYEDSSISLKQGDRVLIFTDGIAEAMRPDGEEFGEDRLTKVVASRVSQSASELNSSLLTEVKGFCNSQLHDDATLVVIAAT